MEPRNYLSGASVNPPAKPAAPSNGYPVTAVPGINDATVPGAFWFYKLGEELRNILIAAGVAPSDDSVTQLISALGLLFTQYGGDPAKTFLLSDATVANEAASLGQIAHPGGSNYSAAGTVVPTSVSFTPVNNDYVIAHLSIGTDSGSASASISVTGATVISNGGNFTAGIGVAFAVLKCTAGTPVTITGSATNSSSANMSAYLNYLRVAAP